MKLRFIALAASAVLSAAAFAAPYDYAVWNAGNGSTTTGTVGGVGVTFSGPYLSVLTNGANNYFNRDASDYTNSTVSNAQAATDNFIQLQGGNQNTYSLTFATPVNNLVIDVLSVGQNGDPVNFNFDKSFTLLSQGGDEWGGNNTDLSVSGNSLTGTEGSGAILFSGSTSTLTWTLPNSEYWYGMSVATPTPEPASMSVFAVAGLGLLIRRRKRA